MRPLECYSKAVDVTPGPDAMEDGAGNTVVSRGIRVGGAGDLEVVSEDGVTSVFKALEVDLVYPIRAAKILATNTTATDIQAWY